MRRAAAVAWVLGVAAVAACAPDLPLSLGSQCELNSDCETPLVCRIGYCRTECSTSRDCALGLDCLQDNQGLGACQLPQDTRCMLDSDCPETLVCTAGECTNECACPEGVPCRDCPPGATCIERPGGARGCFDASTRTCVRNSDCRPEGEGFVCAADQRCRVECNTDADCRFDSVCYQFMFAEPEGDAVGNFCVVVRSPIDAGVIAIDAGTDGG